MRKFPGNAHLQAAVSLPRSSPRQTRAFSVQTNPSFASLENTIKLLKSSADTKNLKFGKSIHALLIITNQATPDHVIQTNSLINLYSKCGQIKVARRLFDKMRDRNLVSWSGLMAGYLHNGFPMEVLNLFRNMALTDYLRPNEYILATVLSSCADCGSLVEGRLYHGYVLKSGLVFHQYVKNALLYMYAMCSDVVAALGVLKSVPGSDGFTYNSVLKVLVGHGYLNEALEVLGSMVKECVKWDNYTYVTLFGLCAGLMDLKLGLQVHNQILKTNVEFDEFISSAVTDMYGKCGEISFARKVFDGMQTRNVVSWTAILAAYFQNGWFEEALKLFSYMEHEGVMPNEYTFAVLLNSGAGLSALGYGNSVHALAVKSGFKYYIVVGNSLINVYAKGGNIEAAHKVFSDMVYRNTITWNAMISGYSHNGLGNEALIAFQDMLAAKEPANYVTFVGVLAACAHLGWVREGFYYLNQLRYEMGIEPGLEHYTCIVRLLCRAGLVEQAENFMRTTPVKWDVVAWRTLLNACHVHRNYRLGKQVAEIVLDMGPDDVGTPEFSLICGKVRELLTEIEPLGYMPDIATVVYDLKEEREEDYTSYHSEKLAIAYGIMKIPPEAPIRVMKNQRMCDDCHTAVKLISKVTNRVIIVRDVNHFHRFQDGFCSCGDYW
ncbi:hypothetical protein Vadar_007729 [Vaccinium darrowii]|uniref:Uncharacterized protein n=1 Tax=Vaccinium darrowii TaxID=229202 RepID=A0ACB7XZ44_9ERIC|nr:hypothetical protein Vadar_007729 [Vaccinium darrowii]